MGGAGTGGRVLAFAGCSGNPRADRCMEEQMGLRGSARRIMTALRVAANASFLLSAPEVTHGTV